MIIVDVRGPAPAGREALVDRIRREIGRVDFWRKDVAQEQLRAEILRYLDDHSLAPFDQQFVVERNHSDAFWERLSRLLPDYVERQRWLREEGACYDL